MFWDKTTDNNKAYFDERLCDECVHNDSGKCITVYVCRWNKKKEDKEKSGL